MSSPIVDALLAALDDDALDQLAEKLAPRLRPVAASPWLTVDEAADRLRCKPQRIYDLVHDGRLQPGRDGRRLLFHRDHLDNYLQSRKEPG